MANFNNALTNLSGGLGGNDVEWISVNKVFVEDQKDNFSEMNVDLG